MSPLHPHNDRRSAVKRLHKKELNGYKKLILKQKESILEELEHISADVLKESPREASGDVSGYTLHMADIATDTYDREFSLGLASNERKLLYEIEDALKRIEEKTYGLCEVCGKPIAKTRLKAVPFTRNCLKCQQKAER
jgi:RNA polymerase-binding protein DksA